MIDIKNYLKGDKKFTIYLIFVLFCIIKIKNAVIIILIRSHEYDKNKIKYKQKNKKMSI